MARYHIAESLYAQEKLDEALAAFLKIVDQAAGTDLGEVAADQVFDVLQAKKDWRAEPSPHLCRGCALQRRPEFQGAARIRRWFRMYTTLCRPRTHRAVATSFLNYARQPER